MLSIPEFFDLSPKVLAPYLVDLLSRRAGLRAAVDALALSSATPARLVNLAGKDLLAGLLVAAGQGPEAALVVTAAASGPVPVLFSWAGEARVPWAGLRAVLAAPKPLLLSIGARGRGKTTLLAAVGWGPPSPPDEPRVDVPCAVNNGYK